MRYFKPTFGVFEIALNAVIEGSPGTFPIANLLRLVFVSLITISREVVSENTNFTWKDIMLSHR